MNILANVNQPLTMSYKKGNILTGSDNRMHSTALQQPEKDLPWRPTAAEVRHHSYGQSMNFSIHF